MEEQEHIALFLSSDDAYAPYLATTIASVAMNTSRYVDYYVFDCGISLKNKSIIETFVEEIDDAMIEFIDVDTEETFADLPEVRYLSKAMYARFLIPTIKPQLNKAIYSDVDVAFTGDIESLWEEDLEGWVIGAVPSQRSLLNEDYRSLKRELGLSLDHTYFMSGLLLIDCEKWRSENTLLSIMKKAKELKDYPDQEILNCTFEKKYKHLDPKYCVIYKIMDEVYTEEEIARLIKEQVIVHYPGDGSSKPWNNPFLPSYKYFFKALKKTPYKRFVFLNQLSFCFKTLLGKFGKKKAS